MNIYRRDAIVILAVLIATIVGLITWIAEDAHAQMQSSTVFVTIHAGLQWGSIECHTEHPFTPSHPMAWDNEYGLTEVGNADGLRNPLMLIMEVDAMTLQVVYEHLGNEFVVGWQCPEYDGIYKDVHMRSPMWGNLNE